MKPVTSAKTVPAKNTPGSSASQSACHLVAATMKRGADAMDGGDSRRGDCNGNRSVPDLKRMRRADEGRDRNRNADTTVKTLADEKETDPHRLAQRQKQIDYGKNTIGYDRYCAQVPRRQRRSGKHPMTPDKTMRIGKKVFDGIVRKWRQALHKYDPPELAEATKTTVAQDTTAATIESKTDPVDSGATDVKSEQGAATTSSCGSTKTSAEPEVTNKTPTFSDPTPPNRSIYENFDEDNFDDDDSDDDLL